MSGVLNTFRGVSGVSKLYTLVVSVTFVLRIVPVVVQCCHSVVGVVTLFLQFVVSVVCLVLCGSAKSSFLLPPFPAITRKRLAAGFAVPEGAEGGL